jgi:hypothetical protein
MLTDGREVADALRGLLTGIDGQNRVGRTSQVWLRVARSGITEETRLAASSGVPRLDTVLLRLGALMRFEPAQLGGAPLEVWIRLPITIQSRRPGARPSPM